MVCSNRENLDVYLLDDDLSVLTSTTRLLDSVGWSVEAFTDPATFLQRAAEAPPNVAVIDIRMPTMDGLEVQTQLRQAAPETRVIILTSYDDLLVRTKAMKNGASGFFVKGVDKKEFLDGIKAVAHSSD